MHVVATRQAYERDPGRLVPPAVEVTLSCKGILTGSRAIDRDMLLNGYK